MKLPIKQMIIQEGILDAIRKNRGTLGLLGGAAAGAGVYHDYKNSGIKSFGEYAGGKLNTLADSAKSGFNSAKDTAINTYKNVTGPTQKSVTPDNSNKISGDVKNQSTPDHSNKLKDDTNNQSAPDHSDKLKHDAIMKQGTDKQTIESALDPARAKAFDADINNLFNEV